MFGFFVRAMCCDVDVVYLDVELLMLIDIYPVQFHAIASSWVRWALNDPGLTKKRRRQSDKSERREGESESESEKIKGKRGGNQGRTESEGEGGGRRKRKKVFVRSSNDIERRPSPPSPNLTRPPSSPLFSSHCLINFCPLLLHPGGIRGGGEGLQMF